LHRSEDGGGDVDGTAFIVCLFLALRENRMLRRIFGPKRDEKTGGWRRLHNEELRNLYSWLSKIIMIKSRRMIWAGHVVRIERRGLLIRYWWEKPEEKRLLRRTRCTREDNIKII
jgi:hypothetical protein